MPTASPVPPVPSAAPGAGRRRRGWAWFGVFLLLVGAPTGWYFGGGYERWQDGRALRGLCRGAVDTAEVRELLDGAGRLNGEDFERRSDRSVCLVRAPDRHGTLMIRIGRAPLSAVESLQALRRDYLGEREGTPVVPVGAGWAGVLSAGPTSEDEGLIVLALACTGTQYPDRLVVELTANPTAAHDGPQDDFASAEQRARLGRIAGRIAARADRIWKCGAPLGGRIEHLPGRADVKVVPRGSTEGTCVGIPGPVREAPTDPTAPIEDCTVLLPDGKSRALRLLAYYPPFAGAGLSTAGVSSTGLRGRAGREGAKSWAFASCPGGEAVFLSYQDEQTAVTARDALAGFARASAARHGCAAPVLP
ncbi:hypothetical protein KSE_66910 [Kitasatospora setae KM-6054]|uniref:Uncharacterized protein n=2 Tax=Streptomycetaceae TaxID=2062 RepID=E4N2R5_KITSK|nr:hypothetical protein KSE_66910 [Kitasatospora setae KM-6054]